MGEKAGGEKRWILITFEWFFQGRYNGLWSYLLMTNMTKEDNSAAALAILHVIHMHACWYDWMRKITLVDILSAAWRQHRERCDWVQSALVCGWWKHIALFLLLPFFFLNITALCLQLLFTFQPLPLNPCLRGNDTMGKFYIWHKKTNTSEANKKFDRNTQTQFSCPANVLLKWNIVDFIRQYIYYIPRVLSVLKWFYI